MASDMAHNGVYEASTERAGYRFVATMWESGGTCYEEVWRHAHGERMREHQASFDSGNLGNASREEYVRVMCASVADAWIRKHKGRIPLAITT